MSRIVRGGSTITLTIASGGTTSGAADVRDFVAAQMLLPATMTSTTIAVHGCDDPNGTFVPIYDKDGNAISVTITANRIYQLPAEALGGSAYIKLVGGSSEGAARTIKLYCKA